MFTLVFLLGQAADVARMDEHRGGGAVVFSADGRWLASHGAEGLHVWELATGLERKLDGASTSARVAPERHFAFVPAGKEIILFESGRFLAWDLETGARVRSVKGPSGLPITSLLSPDGAAFVVVGVAAAMIHPTGSEKTTPLDLADGEAGSLSFSGTGERVALSGTTRGRGGWARAWETATGKEIFSARIEPPGRARNLVIQTPPGSLSADGKILAVARAPGTHVTGVPGGPSTIQLWEVESGKMIAELEGHKGQAWGAAFSGDGTRLATWGATDLVVWNLVSKKPALARSGMIHAAAFSPDGAALAFAASADVLTHKDRTLAVVDLESLKDRFALPPAYVQDLAFSPDGKRLAASSDQGIRLLDSSTGTEVKPEKR